MLGHACSPEAKRKAQLSDRCRRGLARLTLGNHFANLRHKINRNFHRSMRCRFERSLILGYGFFVRLCFVMLEELADPLFILQETWCAS